MHTDLGKLSWLTLNQALYLRQRPPAKTTSYIRYPHEVISTQSQVFHERTISITKRPYSHILIKHVYLPMCSFRLVTYAGSTAKLGIVFCFIPLPPPDVSILFFKKILDNYSKVWTYYFLLKAISSNDSSIKSKYSFRIK